MEMCADWGFRVLVHRPTIHARTPPQPSTTHARTPAQPCTNHARTPPQTYIAHARTPPVLVHLPTKFLIFMLVHLPHYKSLFTVGEFVNENPLKIRK